MLLEVDTGQTITLTVTVSNAAGGLFDPAEITVKVKNPRNAVTTYLYSLSDLTRISLGVFTMRLTLNTAGKWYVHAVADDGAQVYAATEDSLVALTPHVV